MPKRIQSKSELCRKHACNEKGVFNANLSGNTRDNKSWLLTQAAMIEIYALATIK